MSELYFKYEALSLRFEGLFSKNAANKWFFCGQIIVYTQYFTVTSQHDVYWIRISLVRL